MARETGSPTLLEKIFLTAIVITLDTMVIIGAIIIIRKVPKDLIIAPLVIFFIIASMFLKLTGIVTKELMSCDI